MCYNTDGNSYGTADMDVSSTSAKSIRQQLEADCSFLNGKIVVTKLQTTYATDTIGFEYEIFFEGMSGSVDQFRVVSSQDDPIVGTDLVYEQSEERPFGASLKWDVIPSEYFFTKHDAPQVMVSVDGMPALCTGLHCDYTYVVGPETITAFTVAGIQVTITGTDLTEPTSVEMGYINCEVTSFDDVLGQIDCTLERVLPGGKWFPAVYTEQGLVKRDAAVTAHEVTLEITSVSPSTGLNPAGGDIVTITGTNFPESNDARYNLSILISGQARCVP